MKPTTQSVLAALKSLGNTEIAAHSQIFFKTAKGEYGEGDVFLGIRVPVIRQCVKKYRDLNLKDALVLLGSPYHEVRMFALLLMVHHFEESRSDTEAKAICDAYLANVRFVNNWDLVDCSAHKIVGPFLEARDRSVLNRMIGSESLWERRIAVMATFHFIRQGDFGHTFRYAERSLKDPEDLMHKIVGWMLREIGKRDLEAEERFLRTYYRKMPRTMLRYAIEKFDKPRRLAYLNGEID